MNPIITIRETGPTGAAIDARDVRDLAHVRRLLLQALFAIEGNEGDPETRAWPLTKLAMLRGHLASAGHTTKADIRRLLILALLELEDENESRRVVAPSLVLPHALPPR